MAAASVLQRTFGAATLQGGLHLLRVGGAVRTTEGDFPPAAFGRAAAKSLVAGTGALHPGHLGSGRAGLHWMMALQDLSHCFALTG